MLQPHKYRYSNPVHRNEIASALTLLPGLNPQPMPDKNRQRSRKAASKTFEPPMLMARPEKPSRPHPHAGQNPKRNRSKLKTTHAKGKITLGPRQPKGSADIYIPQPFARPLVEEPDKEAA